MPAHHLAIVTGTSSGIGEVLTRTLLQRDWRVVGISRRSAPLTAPQYSHLPLDLGDVDSLTKTLTTRLGPVVKDGDVSRIALVNNAADVALLGQVDQLEPSRMYSFQYGGDIVEYFTRYRRQIKSRIDIATTSGLSAADAEHLQAIYRSMR